MRIGLTSPVVTALPGFHSPWERTAGIDELVAVAAAADRLGFDHLTCSEHVAVPAAVAEQRGGTYWDPLATLSHLAAHTKQIRLATQVLVLGYHHPLAIAKRYGTLDRISGGRLVLGLGVGSLEEEFDLLGASWADRGAVADDALAALRAALGQRLPSYDGPHFSFADLVVEPHAVQDRVPFWIGGSTPRSLRRAVTLGTGWVPFGLGHDQLRAMLDATELPDGFEVVLGSGRPLDPTGDSERTTRALTRTRAAGATVITSHVAADSADHYVEQLEALAVLRDRIEESA
ncbi:TIGR03619 family F420-dependent LLM class oxidoreductase [Nocardioides caeni]|uniref:TIGR03619 family F420-dependent LLM class oxidoreductase n=1 Tax=Nocardioides caeni TaxID=574700 RepID=A0A4S8NFD7_9ACTN|nr:TIGR03619 family F420-dependent LLM class oxidoreductase [Nocardioides caeni]THV14741.1 TIGR03619 family F420-dependent LLM class oxidoreductase [Nocardioides caeni]